MPDAAVRSWPVVPEDLNAPPGIYAIDKFLDHFTQNPTPDLRRLSGLLKAREERSSTPAEQRELNELGEAYQSHLALFRHDVIRLVRRAQLLTKRDDAELPTARREVAELLDGLLGIQSALAEVVALIDRINRSEVGRAPFDAAVVAAKLSPALRRKLLTTLEGSDNPDPHPVAAYLVQILEQVRGLHDWADEFLVRFELISLPRHVRALPKHLASLAVTLHRHRLEKWPPASRRHWLSEFLVVVCQQFQLPMPKQEGAQLADYLGGKIEEVLREARSQI